MLINIAFRKQKVNVFDKFATYCHYKVILPPK